MTTSSFSYREIQREENLNIYSSQTSGYLKVDNFVEIKITDIHYDDVTMSAMASQITSLTIFYSTVYSDPDQSKHQSSASLAFVWGIHRGPVNSPHKWPVTRKMSPFDDVIMFLLFYWCNCEMNKTTLPSTSVFHRITQIMTPMVCCDVACVDMYLIKSLRALYKLSSMKHINTSNHPPPPSATYMRQ